MNKPDINETIEKFIAGMEHEGAAVSELEKAENDLYHEYKYVFEEYGKEMWNAALELAAGDARAYRTDNPYSPEVDTESILKHKI